MAEGDKMLGRAISILRERGTGTTFDQNAEGFSAILAGVSLRGITENEHEATLPENHVDIALSGQKDMFSMVGLNPSRKIVFDENVTWNSFCCSCYQGSIRWISNDTSK